MKLRWILIIGALLIAGPAAADPFFSREDLHGYLDLRLSAADGESSWLNGGFGKTSVSGGGGGFRGRAELAQGMVAWTPHLTWDLDAILVGQYQPSGDRGPTLGEAYLRWRPARGGATRISARAGLFYPPVSLEHEAGAFWVDRDMITPSAINSWIGEEVKVVGVEATVTQKVSGGQISLTGAIFGFNDTAGTLIAFRGWSLDDVIVGAPDHYPLPPLSALVRAVQAPRTNPVFEIDHRPGAYARLGWKPEPNLTLNAVYYDNGGAVGAGASGQSSWRTRFGDAGVRYDLDATNRLIGQAIIGRTRFGLSSGELVADTSFRAAYLRATHDLGRDSLSARADLFDTTNHAGLEYGDTNEQGWAVGADYRKRLSGHADLLFEALHVQSNRPARRDILGLPPGQGQTLLQASLRLRL